MSHVMHCIPYKPVISVIIVTITTIIMDENNIIVVFHTKRMQNVVVSAVNICFH